LEELYLIPLKLQIKNFLSYGPDTQEIDFTRYHMICLSGKNGHGKSALLDAITWAVWGQARKTSGQPKPDHGLLHLGQRNMKVVFDFEFNLKRYRVRREFTFAYNKPTAYLEFGMFADDGDELIPLTDKTIRKTQAKIELLLGLDFDSFINSAFIRQGNSGEFSHKSPKERKEILSNILGLNVYDKLRKAASEKAKFFENERQSLIKLYDRLLLDLSQQAQLQDESEALQIKLKELQDFQDTCELKIQAYKDRQQKLILQRDLHQANKDKLKTLHDIYAKNLTLLLDLKINWRKLLTKICAVFDKAQLEKQKLVLEQELIGIRCKQKKAWELRELLAKYKDSYQKAETALLALHDQQINISQAELVSLQLNLKHAQASFDKDQQDLINLEQSQNLINIKLQAHKQLQVQHDTLQKQFDRYKDFYQRLIVMGNAAKHAQDDLGYKQSYLNQDCPACPLCEQNLSAARKRFLSDQFAKEIGFAQHRVSRVAKLLKDLKAKIYDQYIQLEQFKSDLNQVNILKSQLELNQPKIDLLKISLPLDQVKLDSAKLIINQKLQNIKELTGKRASILTSNHELAILLDQIKLCESDLQINNYQEQALNVKEQELAQIIVLLATDRTENLTEQRIRILEQVSNLVRDLKSKKCEINLLNNLLAQDHDLALKFDNLNLELDTLSKNYAVIKQNRELVLQQLGSIKEQIKKNTQTKIELDNLKKELTNLEMCAQDYKLLVGAFGKDGIQALLIEDAIPEIEQEANYLLGRLTDNQAQLYIESLRDLKSGGTKETLDIKISDNVGLRPYEMFSGGEAFRIDFALRIAISKLLARRAGTALQTLIIDEGFGSQDEEGLAHIMDALYKIQDDFAKIIIVSHLNTMKEQFPVHFFINKTATGSTVSVFEQG
jgi:exonuclease SbcC